MNLETQTTPELKQQITKIAEELKKRKEEFVFSFLEEDINLKKSFVLLRNCSEYFRFIHKQYLIKIKS